MEKHQIIVKPLRTLTPYIPPSYWFTMNCSPSTPVISTPFHEDNHPPGFPTPFYANDSMDIVMESPLQTPTQMVLPLSKYSGLCVKHKTNKGNKQPDSGSEAHEINTKKKQKPRRKHPRRQVALTIPSSSDPREAVEVILMTYDALRRRFLQVEEANYLDKNAYMKAGSIMMHNDLRIFSSKTFGSPQGIEVGDIFYFRFEMILIGLHAHVVSGIDYIHTTIDDEPDKVAVAIISSGGYDNETDDVDVLIYNGHGGKASDKKGQIHDKQLDRGNLALERSLHRSIPVRVIRGIRDNNRENGKIFHYDGLYKIEESWVVEREDEPIVFKFKLLREPGQPDGFAIWKMVEKWRENPASRSGIILPDISSGAERIPVCLVNEVDDEKGPTFFAYSAKVAYSEPISLELFPMGCACLDACLSSDPGCLCAQFNENYSPYSSDGLLVRRKPMVYECSTSCCCPLSCCNRVSQKGIKLRLEVFRTMDRGWGLRSWDPIRAGTFICEYAGEVVAKYEIGKHGEENDYIFDPNAGDHMFKWNFGAELLGEPSFDESPKPLPFFLSAMRTGNVSRFINHSCSPNIFWQPVMYDHGYEDYPHVMFFAIKHIPPLTELTYDYGRSGRRSKQCLCGSKKCRGSFGYAQTRNKGGKKGKKASKFFTLQNLHLLPPRLRSPPPHHLEPRLPPLVSSPLPAAPPLPPPDPPRREASHSSPEVLTYKKSRQQLHIGESRISRGTSEQQAAPLVLFELQAVRNGPKSTYLSGTVLDVKPLRSLSPLFPPSLGFTANASPTTPFICITPFSTDDHPPGFPTPINANGSVNGVLGSPTLQTPPPMVVPLNEYSGMCKDSKSNEGKKRLGSGSETSGSKKKKKHPRKKNPRVHDALIIPSSSSDPREPVEVILLTYDALRRRLLQLDEANNLNKSAHLKAGTIMMDNDLRINSTKTFGSLQGIEVGDIFYFRFEMCLIGLHAQSMSGIDYINTRVNDETDTLALSIVSSGGYENETENADVLIYSGQGGKVSDKKAQVDDQKLERGNLALERSLHRSNLIRVIRTTRDNLVQNGKIYYYDGLYKIHESWVEKGKSGFNVFKYKLLREAGQPDGFAIWKLAEKWKENPATRSGIILTDISSGVESIPVCLVNEVNTEKGPEIFSYSAKVVYSKPVSSGSFLQGCGCPNVCLPSDSNCSCSQRNDGDSPYSANGLLVRRRPMVYECGSLCHCSPTCRNRVSQKGIKLRFEVFRTQNRGWGLRSWDPIRAGTFICEYAGEVVEKDEIGQHGEDNDYIFDPNAGDKMFKWNYGPELLGESSFDESPMPLSFLISARRTGNVARFINHSCSPNVFWQPVLNDHVNEDYPHIMFFAIKHIPPLTELTYDYGQSGMRSKQCLCGSRKCRGSFG